MSRSNGQAQRPVGEQREPAVRMAMSRVLAGQHRGSARRSASCQSESRTAAIDQGRTATGGSQITISMLNSKRLFAGKWLRARDLNPRLADEDASTEGDSKSRFNPSTWPKVRDFASACGAPLPSHASHDHVAFSAFLSCSIGARPQHIQNLRRTSRITLCPWASLGMRGSAARRFRPL